MLDNSNAIHSEADGVTMARFFTLDGSPGTFLSTDEVNIFSADQAHLVQAQPWVGVRGAVDDLGIQPDGFGALRLTVDEVGVPRISLDVLGTIAIADGSAYSISLTIDNETGADAELWLRIRTTSLGDIQPVAPTVVPPGESRLIVTANSNLTDTLAQIWLRISNVDVALGDSFVFAKLRATVNDDTDPSFIPSLDVVGVNEIRNPSDMPVVGVTDLTVGAGWAGNAVRYDRFDGPGGPAVARLSPYDYPGAEGAVPDGTQWVDSTGRTWTANGAGITFTVTPPTDGPPATFTGDRRIVHADGRPFSITKET